MGSRGYCSVGTVSVQGSGRSSGDGGDCCAAMCMCVLHPEHSVGRTLSSDEEGRRLALAAETLGSCI